MKSHWGIAVVGFVTLIFGAAFTWHFIAKSADQRKLADDARACRVRAEHGDVNAQAELADMYYQGRGLPQNDSEAVTWYRKAANQGNAKAQYDLAFMYHEGKGVPQDYIAALDWCRKAADQGYAKAQDALGSVYYEGKEVSQDYATAIRWYRKSAEQGYAKAQYDLGYMYYYGYAVPQDRGEANRLFHQAAAQGNEDARRVIGLNKVDLTARSKFILSLKCLAALFFGVAFLKSGQRPRTRAQIATGVTALLFSLSFMLDLFWYSYVGHPQSAASMTGLYLARHLVGGAIVAMLMSIVHAKSANIALIAAGTIFIAFIVFAVIRSELMRIPLTIPFLCFVGLPIGMSIPSAIFLWLDRKQSGQRLEGKGDVVSATIDC
jgi:TPR repeat protein